MKSKSKLKMKNPFRLNKLNRKNIYINIGYVALLAFFIYICYKTYTSQKRVIEGLTAQQKKTFTNDINACGKACKDSVKTCIKECEGDKDCKEDCKDNAKEDIGDCNDICLENCEEKCPTDPDECDDGKEGRACKKDTKQCKKICKVKGGGGVGKNDIM